MASCATELNTISDTSPKLSWLFVQSGTTTTLEQPDGDGDSYALTMNGVAKLVGFTERPYHLIEVLTVPEWQEVWSQGCSDSFNVSPPNSALSFTLTPEQRGESPNTVGFMLVTLTEPKFTEDADGTHTVNYRLTNVDTSFLPREVLEGTPDGGIALQNVTLVIDSKHGGKRHHRHGAIRHITRPPTVKAPTIPKPHLELNVGSLASTATCTLCKAGMAGMTSALQLAMDAGGEGEEETAAVVTAGALAKSAGVTFAKSAAVQTACDALGDVLAPMAVGVASGKLSEKNASQCLSQLCIANAVLIIASGGQSFAPIAGWALGQIACGCENIAQACSKTSDRRLKTNIQRTGHSPSGIPEYSFRYRHDPSSTLFHGAMAQDLLATHPEAVVRAADGFYRVRYDLIDVSFYALRN